MFKINDEVLVNPFSDEPQKAVVVNVLNGIVEVNFGRGWIGFIKEKHVVNKDFTLKDAFNLGYDKGIQDVKKVLNENFK